MKPLSLTLAAVIATAVAGTAMAKDIEVKMLNKGTAGAMVFEPNVVKADVGDTVVFVPVDKGHNAETMLTPDGADAVTGKINEEVRVTLDREGVWVIRCKPHYALGMIAVLSAGQPANLDAAKAIKAPGKAGKVLPDLLAQVAQ